MKSLSLSKIFDTVRDFLKDMEHGPYRPHPEIQKQMEDKGYTYKEELVPNVGFAAWSNRIYAPNGKEVLHNGKSAESIQFTKDYNELLAAYKAQQISAQPPTQNGPQ